MPLTEDELKLELQLEPVIPPPRAGSLGLGWLIEPLAELPLVVPEVLEGKLKLPPKPLPNELLDEGAVEVVDELGVLNELEKPNERASKACATLGTSMRPSATMILDELFICVPCLGEEILSYYLLH